MKEGFDTKFLNSFYAWLDYRVLKAGDGFTNTSSVLYPCSGDYRFPFNSTYSSPYKQWVWDSSVSTATIPSGISGSNGFIQRGVSGLSLDFLNGAVRLSGGITSNFSGSYAVKKYNIYVSNDLEEDLIFENRYLFNPKIGKAYSGIQPYDIVLPAIFINYFNSRNEPFAFGGMDDSKLVVRATVIDNEYQSFINLISLLKDSSRTVFPVIDTVFLPLNIYGDLKYGSYNYETIRDSGMANGNPVVYIEDISYMQLIDKSIQQRGELVGFVNFNLSCIRYPRLY